MRLRRMLWASVLAAAIAVPVTIVHGQGPGPTGPRVGKMYIVQMSEAPVTAYNGGIRGFAATRPATGTKFDPSTAQARAYGRYLLGRHDAALARVGGGRKAYSYQHVFNGFAAELTEEQVAKLKKTSGVLSVMRDELREMDTSTTPDFLGLTERFGLWTRLGGPRNAGRGIIIGLVDSGIWPESPSFDNRNFPRPHRFGRKLPGGKPAPRIKGWYGECVSGEEFDESLCNEKLIGARWYNKGYGGDEGINADRPWEFASARDFNGHGTHTSATAAGNAGVKLTGTMAAFGVINGMAPGARVAMYKALWSEEDASTANGYTSDLVAAIDQAVADGVDVISYSVSGSKTSFRDAVEIAFLNAAKAGVFVAASAGNSGPAASTVAHPSPWITTVAAGTHNRTMTGSTTLGSGASYTGASTAPRAVTAPLINASDAGLAGADATMVSLCYAAADNGGTPVLDPAKVTGKIVVCDRGVTARVSKSLAVAEAGGVGMILLNPTSNSLNGDIHSVPTVHLQDTAYSAVHAYAAAAGATATIRKAWAELTTAAPYTASFSSRGPLQASSDLLKPDLIAPGQDIMASVAPPGNGGATAALYSGTSMSTPHVAGLAALLKALHPTWSPMAIKSALMTTAYDVLDGDATTPDVIFSQGAGHVEPNKAMDPGLVFDSDYDDWLGFLCGTQLDAANCTEAGIPVLDPSDFNAPSIAIGALLDTQTVTRTVTNVGAPALYHFSVDGLEGFKVTVSPATFALWRGQSRKLSITIKRTTAPLGVYAGGYISWSDLRHHVRIPVVVKPLGIVAPAQVAGPSYDYNVTFGYTGGMFTATPRGLTAAATASSTIGDSESRYFRVPISSGTTYARFSLFDADVSPDTDLDLYVYYCPTSSCSVVGSSGGATSQEEVNLINPTAGTYYLEVYGFKTANPSAFTASIWRLGSASAGNMTVTAPTTATLGATGTISLAFSGLTPGKRYLGSVAYGDGSGVEIAPPTIVRVDAQ